MAKLSYIEHLNIPIKYSGSILRSYEYNATVYKINEIVDNLELSYELDKHFPKFDIVDDIFVSTGPGYPTVIHNETDGKLYPITSSAYVLVDINKSLDDELQLINSQLTSSIDDVYDRIHQTEQLIDEYNELSYSYTVSYVNLFNENFVAELDNLRSYVNILNSYVTNIVDDISTVTSSYISDIKLDGVSGIFEDHIVNLTSKLQYDEGTIMNNVSDDFLTANGL